MKGAQNSINIRIQPLVLIVDDQVKHQVAFKKALHRHFRLELLASREEALGLIEQLKPDVVILDLQLMGRSGLDLCKIIRNRPLHEYIGLVILTEQEDPDVSLRFLAAGADAFATQESAMMQILGHCQSALRVRGTMKELSEINSKLQRANDRLKKLSLTDELTGLYNMRFMARQIRNEFKRAERYRKKLSLIMIDIDQLRRVNEANDHLTGSFVLAQLGQFISDSIRTDIDYGSRFGGDEFMLLLPETDQAGAFIVADRLRAKVENHIFDNGHHAVKITLSIGLVSYDGTNFDGASVEEMTRLVEKALLQAKAKGRNQVQIAEGFNKSRSAG